MSSISTYTSGSSTHKSLSFLRVPKSGFGGKSKMDKDKSRDKKKNDAEELEKKEEEWHIPYKGPYESAPATRARLKKRERPKWKDGREDPAPVRESGIGDEWKNGSEVDSYRGEHHHQHPGPSGHHHHDGSFSTITQDSQKQPSRSQLHPFPSVTQNQPDQLLSLRSNYSNQNPKISSYINLDAAGGVGDSPVPSSSSFRHMQYARDGDDGITRPWSAGEAKEGRELRRKATLRQRSSLASLFEKYNLLKKLAKLGMGGGGGGGGGSGMAAGKETNAGVSVREQPPPRPPRQRPPPWQSQSQPPSHRPESGHSRPKLNLRINPPRPPPSSSTLTVDDDHEDDADRRKDKASDIIPVPDTDSGTASASVYSQPSPFTPKGVQRQELSVSASVPLEIVDEDGHVESYYDMLMSSSVNAPYQSFPPPTEVRITAEATSDDVKERHPYAATATVPSVRNDSLTLTNNSDPTHSHRPSVGKQKSRLSAMPQSRLSLATLRSIVSSPELRTRGQSVKERGFAKSDDAHAERAEEMEGGAHLRPHVREVLHERKEKEKWLSTNLIAIFLPKPKFRIKAKLEKTKMTDNGEKERSRSAIDLTTSGGQDATVPDIVRPQAMPMLGDDTRHVPNMAEFGGIQGRSMDSRDETLKQNPTTHRQSYAYDDLSLLSLERVLEEGDRLEKDRIKWQAQAINSLGNKHARNVSRSRAKSLTQAGRQARSAFGQPQQQQQPEHHHTQQSSIDFLAARAYLGDQDVIPLVGGVNNNNNNPVPTVGSGPTSTAVKRTQFEFPKHGERETHERQTSGSSGVATSSGGHRSSNGVSAQSYPSGSVSGDNNHHGHKRNDSWCRAVHKAATSLPQLCGLVHDDDDNNDHQPEHQQQQSQQLQQQQDPAWSRSLEVALKNDPATRNSATHLNTNSGDSHENRRPSPSPSNTSGGCVLVGIAISTPSDFQEPCRDRQHQHHPYTIGADRSVDTCKRKDEEYLSGGERGGGRSPPVIVLPDHPYAQGGLSASPYLSSSVSAPLPFRGKGEERGPDYVGPHPATAAVSMTKELMANLGLSELSARHRLPPQVIRAQQQHVPVDGDGSCSQSFRLQSQSQSPQQQGAQQSQEKRTQQPQEQPQEQKSNDRLYVKVDDIRNSYQAIQPYLRVDSNVRPADRLWVTYSPGNVREVLPNEVSEYSPHITQQHVPQIVASSSGSSSGPGPGPDGDAGTDFFLQRYQRMSTVYQDTASMGQVLGNAMYDSSSSIQEALRRTRSVDSGIGTSEGHQQQPTQQTTPAATTTKATTRELATMARSHALDLPETKVEKTGTSDTRDTAGITTTTTATTTMPRVLFGPRLNSTLSKPTAGSAPNLGHARAESSSSVLLHENQQTAFAIYTDPFRREGQVLTASPERSSSGACTSPPTSPTVPRVGSPDNLEPFHGLFYHPPGESESDSLPSPQFTRIPASHYDDEREVMGGRRSHMSLDDEPWIPGLGGSGSRVTTLMNDVNDELEHMMIERRQRAQRERSGSIQSSYTWQSQIPSTSTSDSASTSTTSRGIIGGSRSRRINTEAGPLDFVLDRKHDPPPTQSGYIPRPNRISVFYPATPIPEDIEFSRASSPFEGTVEDETARLSAGSNNNNSDNANDASNTESNNVDEPDLSSTTTGSLAFAPPRLVVYPNEEEDSSLYSPEARASYLTTTDTLSRMSTLSDFPVPPNGITPEEMSLLATLPQQG